MINILFYINLKFIYFNIYFTRINVKISMFKVIPRVYLSYLTVSERKLLRSTPTLLKTYINVKNWRYNRIGLNVELIRLFCRSYSNALAIPNFKIWNEILMFNTSMVDRDLCKRMSLEKLKNLALYQPEVLDTVEIESYK